MRKTLSLKKRIYEELAHIPNISIVCKKVGITRQTFYRWRKEDRDFHRETEEYFNLGVDSVSDLAESKLIEKINQGDMKAITHWLDNNSRRYIKPRKAITDVPAISTGIIGNEIVFKRFDIKKD
jgi:hypothetical protein